jgi:hypothetical protein
MLLFGRAKQKMLVGIKGVRPIPIHVWIYLTSVEVQLMQ